jgi:O-acetylhomoserine (thiol)-lyase
MQKVLVEAGVKIILIDIHNEQLLLDTIKANPSTKLIHLETPANPTLQCVDIESICKIAHAHGVKVSIDNTVATPYLLNPIQYGADIVIHSLTKYITGNGTSLGGVIIDAGNFDWSNGKFPEFTEPSAGYHGLKYYEALGAASFIAKVRIEGLRDFGAALSPFNAFQTIQGLETLEIRIKKHSENALALAQWLQAQEQVAWVNYPGLISSKYYDLAQQYLPEGQSGIVTFGLKGGYEAAKKVADGTKLFSLLANIGDTKSLIIHPASTTHQQLSDAEQETTGVTKDLIRLSVGLEDIEDLKADLKEVFVTIKTSQLI